jgi:2,3-bisphosphoglycerate-dependent phosphoglycerate mutase
MQLTLIRHGQSTYNLENRFTGDVDVPLTQLGREEALQAGKKIKDYHYDFAYTSVLERAEETLQIILQEIGQTIIPIKKNKALNERRYGNLQGLNKAETAVKFGDAQVLIWRRSYDVRPPGGESLEDTFNRTVPYYKWEIEPNLLEGKNILVVAHGNSLRALVMYLEKIGKEDILKLNIPTGVPRNYNFDSTLKILNVAYL